MSSNFPLLYKTLDAMQPFVPEIYSGLCDSRDGKLSIGTKFSIQITRALNDPKPFEVILDGDNRTIEEIFKGSESEEKVRKYLNKMIKANSGKDSRLNHYHKSMKSDEIVDCVISDLIQYTKSREDLLICLPNKQQIKSLVDFVGLSMPYYGHRIYPDTKVFITPKPYMKEYKEKNSCFLLHYHPLHKMEDVDEALYDSIRPSYSDMIWLSNLKIPMIIATDISSVKYPKLNEKSDIEQYYHYGKSYWAGTAHLLIGKESAEAYSSDSRPPFEFAGNWISTFETKGEFDLYCRITGRPPFWPWEGWDSIRKSENITLKEYRKGLKEIMDSN